MIGTLADTHKLHKLGNGEYCLLSDKTVVYEGIMYDVRQFHFNKFQVGTLHNSSAQARQSPANITKEIDHVRQ